VRKLCAILNGLVLLAGCAVGPNYKQPPVTAPDYYRDIQGPAQSDTSFADLPWWEVFHDDQLQKLIDEALGTGYDIQIAAWRVEEARARAGIARSEFWPQVGYSGEYSRSQQSQFTGPITHPTVNLHAVNVNFGWELDLWGRVRRLNEAAKAQYLATEAGRRGVLISLVSDVARTYFQLRELDEELAIANETVDAFKKTSDLFQRKLSEGAASALETAYASAAYKQVASGVPELERQIEATENVLNVLLGRNPNAISRGMTLAAQPLVPEVPAGLPSMLLQRRPDIVQAEQELIAANAGVGVATANFFPTISLTGLFGAVSPEVSNLFPHGQAWSIAAGLFGPLFQGGRLVSEYDVSFALREQARLHYEQTVTNAFGETTTVLYARGKIALSVSELESTVGHYQEMVRLTNLRYNSGLANYFEVLYSMQQLFPAQIALARARLELVVDYVDIYKALGGGWKVETSDWQRGGHGATPAPTPSQ